MSVKINRKKLKNENNIAFQAVCCLNEITSKQYDSCRLKIAYRFYYLD